MANVHTTFTFSANTGNLQAQIGAAIAQINKLNQAVQQMGGKQSKISMINAEFIQAARGTKMWSASLVDLESNASRFGKTLERQHLSLRQYREHMRQFTASAQGQRGVISELAKEQVRLGQAQAVALGMGTTGRAKAVVMTPGGLNMATQSTAVALANKELQIYNKLLADSGTAVVNWGKNTQWAGRQLMVGLTIPMAMFGQVAKDSFIEVDKELVRMEKVYGSTLNNIGQSTEEIRSQVEDLGGTLAREWGVAMKDTAGIAADLAATGKEGKDLIDSTRETARLAVLGEVDRQTAMGATLSLQTAFNMSTKELTESIDFLNAVENQTSTTLEDLAIAIPKAGPVVKALGGDVKDLALMLTAMREGGINAAEGANAIKSGLSAMINPTKQASELAMQYGIDLNGIVQANRGELMPTLVAFREELMKLDEFGRAQVVEQIFGRYQFARISALFDNLGREGSQTQQVMQLMGASTQELAAVAANEMDVLVNSTSMKFQRAVESFKVAIQPIGEGMTVFFTKMIDAASALLEIFDKLPGPVKTVVTGLIGLVALAGPLIMIAGVFGNLLGTVIKGIAWLRTKLRGGTFDLLTEEMVAANQAGGVFNNTVYDEKQALKELMKVLAGYQEALMGVAGATEKASAATEELAVATQTVKPAPLVVDPAVGKAGLGKERKSWAAVFEDTYSNNQREAGAPMPVRTAATLFDKGFTTKEGTVYGREVNDALTTGAYLAYTGQGRTKKNVEDAIDKVRNEFNGHISRVLNASADAVEAGTLDQADAKQMKTFIDNQLKGLKAETQAFLKAYFNDMFRLSDKMMLGAPKGDLRSYSREIAKKIGVENPLGADISHVNQFIVAAGMDVGDAIDKTAEIITQSNAQLDKATRAMYAEIVNAGEMFRASLTKAGSMTIKRYDTGSGAWVSVSQKESGLSGEQLSTLRAQLESAAADIQEGGNLSVKGGQLQLNAAEVERSAAAAEESLLAQEKTIAVQEATTADRNATTAAKMSGAGDDMVAAANKNNQTASRMGSAMSTFSRLSGAAFGAGMGLSTAGLLTGNDQLLQVGMLVDAIATIPFVVSSIKDAFDKNSKATTDAVTNMSRAIAAETALVASDLAVDTKDLMIDAGAPQTLKALGTDGPKGMWSRFGNQLKGAGSMLWRFGKFIGPWGLAIGAVTAAVLLFKHALDESTKAAEAHTQAFTIGEDVAGLMGLTKTKPSEIMASAEPASSENKKEISELTKAIKDSGTFKEDVAKFEKMADNKDELTKLFTEKAGVLALADPTEAGEEFAQVYLAALAGEIGEGAPEIAAELAKSLALEGEFTFDVANKLTPEQEVQVAELERQLRDPKERGPGWGGGTNRSGADRDKRRRDQLKKDIEAITGQWGNLGRAIGEAMQYGSTSIDQFDIMLSGLSGEMDELGSEVEFDSWLAALKKANPDLAEALDGVTNLDQAIRAVASYYNIPIYFDVNTEDALNKVRAFLREMREAEQMYNDLSAAASEFVNNEENYNSSAADAAAVGESYDNAAKAIENANKAAEKANKASQKAYEDQIEAKQDAIDVIEDEIDVIENQIDAINEQADANKAALETAKEAADFYRDQQKLTIDYEAAIASGDYAAAAGIAVEREQGAADFAYNETVDKIDDEAKAATDAEQAKIDAKQATIDGINAEIDAINDLKDAEQEAFDAWSDLQQERLDSINENKDAAIKAAEASAAAWSKSYSESKTAADAYVQAQIDGMKQSQANMTLTQSQIEASAEAIRLKLIELGYTPANAAAFSNSIKTGVMTAWAETLAALNIPGMNTIAQWDAEMARRQQIMEDTRNARNADRQAGAGGDEGTPSSRYHEGGRVSKTGGRRHAGPLKPDEVDAVLLTDEWVVPREAVREYGTDYFESLVNGKGGMGGDERSPDGPGHFAQAASWIGTQTALDQAYPIIKDVMKRAVLAQAQVPAVSGGAITPSSIVGAIGNWLKPLASYRITSKYGMRVNPVTGKRAMHQGIDLAAPMGTPIRAAESGQIIQQQINEPVAGNALRMQNPDGWQTRYLHMSRFNKGLGDRASKGDTLGYVGSTGRSTGPHLHFEMKKNGALLDPQSIIPFKKGAHRVTQDNMLAALHKGERVLSDPQTAKFDKAMATMADYVVAPPPQMTSNNPVYNLSVNVAGTNASPEAIANATMRAIWNAEKTAATKIGVKR